MTETSPLQGRRIAVLGAGLAGLSAALRLVRAGADVTVFEADEHVGGRARTDHVDDFRVDVGMQFVGSMYGHFLQLVRDIGLGGALRSAPGRDALWRNGKAHEVVYGSVTSMVASGSLPFTTKMRLGATYVPFLARHSEALSLLHPERIAAAGLDTESIEAWGRREIDDTFVRSLVYPQLGAYYASDPAETSSGLYHLLAHHGMDVELFALEGGTGRVPEKLRAGVEEAGGAVRLSTPVEMVELGGSARVVADGQDAAFDGVVSGLPATVLRELLVGAPSGLTDWLSAVRYTPVVTAAFLLDQPVNARYFGLAFPQGQTRFTSAICVEQNKPASLVPEGKGLLLAVSTPEAATELIGEDSRTVVDRMLPEVEITFPGVSRSVERARVYRWPVGSPLYYPGYLGHLGRFDPEGIEGSGPLSIAGDYLYSPSIEGAVVSGQRAADRTIQRFNA